MVGKLSFVKFPGLSIMLWYLHCVFCLKLGRGGHEAVGVSVSMFELGKDRTILSQ